MESTLEIGQIKLERENVDERSLARELSDQWIVVATAAASETGF